MNKAKSILALCGLSACFSFNAEALDLNSAVEVKGLIQAGWSDSDTDVPWMQSWLRKGTGLTRYDNENEGVDIVQAALEGRFELTDALTFDAAGIYYPDGDKGFGFTEALLTYKPLSPGWRSRYRLGMFYPEMSFENPDTAWNSPYTYTYSVINSWIAEEMRILGFEGQWTRPGRSFNSPHSWTLNAALYQHNDTAGTLLTWRGWAMHNRQTRYGERVEMADYPSLMYYLNGQPSWVEPFAEIDDRVGAYIGGHWQYQKRSDLRLYYYYNEGDPLSKDRDRQYAWRTEFSSLAWQYRFNKSTRLLTQWMQGSTTMGPNAVSRIDYESFYIMLSHKWNQHRFSLRYDDFETVETDNVPQDPNDSDGHAWTLAWRYDVHKNWQVGAEWLSLESYNENRYVLWNWPAEESQQQIQAVVQYKF